MKSEKEIRAEMKSMERLAKFYLKQNEQGMAEVCEAWVRHLRWVLD